MWAALRAAGLISRKYSPCEQSCTSAGRDSDSMVQLPWPVGKIGVDRSYLLTSTRKAFADRESLSKRAFPIMPWSYGVAAVLYFHLLLGILAHEHLGS